MSIFVSILVAFWGMLFVCGLMTSMVTNHLMSEEVAVGLGVVFLVMFIVAIISRHRLRRTDPACDTRDAGKLLKIAAVIAAIVATAKIIERRNGSNRR